MTKRRGNRCSSHGASAWRIVQTEAVYSGAVMATLKALSGYGILPELDAEKVEERFRPAVAQALARVLDSAFKESPGSVVDNCRDAMQAILSSWLAQNGSPDAVIGNELAKIAAAVAYCPTLFSVCRKLLGNTGCRPEFMLVFDKMYRAGFFFFKAQNV